MAQSFPASALPIASHTLRVEETGDEAIVFDSSAQSFHLLNDTAYAILKACNASNTVQDIAGLLALKFNCADLDSIRNDIAETIHEFLEKRLIMLAVGDYQLPEPALTPAGDESPLVAISVSGISMFPILLSGDKVLVKKSLPAELKTGEIVVWLDESGGLIAHRICSINASAEPPIIITKGDLCGQPDPPVPMNRMIGKVMAILREGGIQWIVDFDANRDGTETEQQSIAHASRRPSFKRMQVLDLQEISAESIRCIESIEDVGLVLLSPRNATALSKEIIQNVNCIFVVPENYRVYTGQPEFLPEMLEFMPSPLRLAVSGQIFLTEFDPAGIQKGIAGLILNGQAFVSSAEAQAALEERTKIVSGEVCVIPRNHFRWIGTSIVGPEYADRGNDQALIALGNLVVSQRLSSIPESIARFNSLTSAGSQAATK